MKFLYVIFLLFSILPLSAQVGIGTTAPEKELHIAGSTSTIRIEALNSVNNDINDGVKLPPAFVDANGTITLVSDQAGGNASIFLTDGSSTFSNLNTVQNPIGFATTISNIYSYTITLPSDAFIEVKYSLAFLVYNTYDTATGTGTKITDGQARQIKNYFTIDSGTTQYGLISQNYYNIDVGGGLGYFYNTGIGYIELPAGTYTIKFYADIGDSSTSSTAVVFGGNKSLLRIRIY